MDSHINPRPYLRVPDRLLRMYAYDPLMIGVYVAVARCAFSARSSVPLSPADLAEWSLGRRVRHPGILRRIQKLTGDGWLIAERGNAVKLHLLPAWEPSSHNALFLWQFAKPQQGKPGHVRTQRVALDLLDIYIGRIDPQPGRRPALVTRYLDKPVLDLADIGTFALALIANPPPTDHLVAASLWSSGTYQSVPTPPAALEYLTNSGQCNLSMSGKTLLKQAESAGATMIRSGTNGSGKRSSKHTLNRSRNGSLRLCHKSLSGAASEKESDLPYEAGGMAAWDSRDSGTRRIPPRTSHDVPASDRAGGGTATSERAHGEDLHQHNRTRRELLEAIGIRHTGALADCSLDLIQAWHTALQNAVFAARFADPAAYAYTQLRAGQMPPEKPGHIHVPRSIRSEHYQPVSERAFADHEALVTRARAIAGSTDELLLCYIIEALRSGLSDTEANEVAHERLKQDGHNASEGVCYVSRTGRS